MTKTRDINKDITPAERANIASSVPVDEVASFGGDTLPEYEAPSAADRGDLPDAPTEDKPVEVEVKEEVADKSNGTAESKTDPELDKDAVDDAPVVEKDKADEPSDTAPKKKLSKAQERIQKEVVKRKAAEKELAELKAAQKGEKVPAAKSAEPFKAYTDDEFKTAADAQLDGDYAPMRELMSRSISSAVTAATETAVAQASENARTEIATASTNAKLADVANEIGEAYPELDSKSGSANQDYIEETLGLRNFYAERGSSYPDALREAAETVAHKYGLGSDEAPVSDNPLADAPAVGKKKTDIQAKIDLSQKESGKLGGDGEKNRELKPDLLGMSEEQFAKVSAEELARARGDII